MSEIASLLQQLVAINSINPDLVADGPGEGEPRRGALVADVERSRQPRHDQAPDRLRQVGGERGAAVLVVDDGELVAFGRGAQHRFHEVAPVRAAHPLARPDHHSGESRRCRAG